jgi:hypothetical protein
MIQYKYNIKVRRKDAEEKREKSNKKEFTGFFLFSNS